ncbi:YfbM family protein [Sphingobium sp. 3R8]|uniref:DUF1877 family protein n=1 Tax=Sphingobium sp. 3R8 TaxID=2874921 RepID=UPI001CCED01D|nr:DUF1877 family protein [Sphingobium sp. 3R8]MBZ9648916.1 YfbM family protein [Sphingobium sp. 3R8]
MGIAYSLIRAKPEVVDQLRGRPKAVAEFVYQDPDAYEPPKPGFFARLSRAGVVSDNAPVPDRGKDDEADLDKAWHLVHYLLTGKTGRVEGPLGLIADDLHPLADLDLGLGKPNVISVDATKAFAEAAQSISDEVFLARFIPEQMPTDELYMGDVVARGDHDDMKEYSLENFHFLRDFAVAAARNGEAIITYYT